MHRSVDEIDLLRQATGDCRWEALVEGRRLMSREVVAYQPDTLRSRVVLFEKASHHPGELPTATALGDLDLSPTAQGLESHKHVSHASPFVVRVETSATSGRDRQQISYLL